MSKNEVVLPEEKVFCIDRAKQGRAACKKCKEKCLAGELRIAKLAPSPSGFGKFKNWYHVDCIFQVFLKQRSTTIRITSCDDINGWGALGSADRNYVLRKISDNELAIAEKSELKVSRKQTTLSNKKVAFKRGFGTKIEKSNKLSSLNNAEKDYSKDLYFREFRRFVADVGNKSDNSDCVNIIKKVFVIGRDGNGFKGDMLQWCRLLFPEIHKRSEYNLQIRHLIKIFSKIFNIDKAIINTGLETGSDLGEVIQNCYETNKKFQPAKKSLLLIQEIDEFLHTLTLLQKEDEQIKHFEQFLHRCTSNDLKVVIRIITHSLRIGTTLQQVLETIHPSIYKSYRTCKNLEIALRIFKESSTSSTDLMAPIQPLSSESCRSIKQILKKCVDGCYAEIKYHGERIQIHKDGSNFKYFSKNLKPISYYKTAQTKHILIKSFPSAKNFIIDCTFVYKKFGKLNKKTEITDKVCIYVFDCLYYNGVSLTNKSIEMRKNVLKANLKEIPNQVMLLPYKIVNDKKQMLPLIDKVLDMERETIILKNIKSVYDSRIPCWFTIERESLYSGYVIEPLHLIMLGYFNDHKGSITTMSYFLMGCYDTSKCKYCTVVKVFVDFDTKTCEKLQDELNVVEINRDISKVPDWLICTKTMVPDFVTKISANQLVWEITGSEYITNCNVHTADCISIKHPRILNMKSSKKASEVTLDYVKNLCANSKQIKLAEFAQQKEEKTSLKRKRNTSSTSVSSKPGKILKVDNELSKTETDQISLKTNIFEAIRLLVESGGEIEFQDALRSFIDHGGTILKLENWKDATHILHLEDSILEQNIRCPKNAQHIIVEWIIESVNNNELQDFRSYTVRWEPIQKVVA